MLSCSYVLLLSFFTLTVHTNDQIIPLSKDGFHKLNTGRLRTDSEISTNNPKGSKRYTRSQSSMPVSTFQLASTHVHGL